MSVVAIPGTTIYSTEQTTCHSMPGTAIYSTGKTTGHSQMKTSAAQMIVRRAAGKYFFQVNFPSRHRASHVKTSEYMAPPLRYRGGSVHSQGACETSIARDVDHTSVEVPIRTVNAS